MASGSPTNPQLAIAIATMAFAMLMLAAAAAPPLSGDFEDDKVHEFLRVLDQAAVYRRECFGECAKGCYCTDNPYSCLRECMPTPPTRRCGATYGTVQGLFSSSATFTPSTTAPAREGGSDGAGGEGFFSSAT
ncbi:unnamed protein product [Urochloa humidicola]